MPTLATLFQQSLYTVTRESCPCVSCIAWYGMLQVFFDQQIPVVDNWDDYSNNQILLALQHGALSLQ